ncbi:MAG: hypothetical protein A2289_07200 [Deltaproteobacteria bacterium RIFOXYA12_FULL_58_15]|nr:MAG: hypothetical protein A2289_07200 [Deltaproteobacteria bacterium RIFOXYA12_FULL_58_15]
MSERAKLPFDRQASCRRERTTGSNPTQASMLPVDDEHFTSRSFVVAMPQLSPVGFSCDPVSAAFTFVFANPAPETSRPLVSHPIFCSLAFARLAKAHTKPKASSRKHDRLGSSRTQGQRVP